MPVLAVVMDIWMIIGPNAMVLLVFTTLLWLMFLIGFVGLGGHEYSRDRTSYKELFTN